MDFELSGKHVLVTGGTRGIGRAITFAFAAQGATVTACYLADDAAAAACADELKAQGGAAQFVRADVADGDDVDRLIETAYDVYGPVDVLVNNAGVISHLPLADLEPAEWSRIVDTNLGGTYRMIRAGLRRLAEPASIVNVASAVAHHGMPNAAHYVASKAAIFGLTRALCKELGPRGIRVNALACGVIDNTGQVNPNGDAGRAVYENMTALHRLGTPAEVADAVLFLASNAARYVTGAVLDVDGGI
jgi:3-oxoacyl-[acyl-carrier protein] reductase